MPRSRRRVSAGEHVERPPDLDPAIPFPPMEAELVRELPEGDGWQYEPKWDGFRGLLENGSGELRLWSRNARPLLRYFPELEELGAPLPPRSALDGEIVIERGGVLDFDSMQMRLHPAESRVRKLSAEIPARFVVFDVLIWKGEEVWREPLSKFKTPADYIYSSYRALSIPLRDKRRTLQAFEALGQRNLSPGSPAGWLDTSAEWDGSSALLKRIAWADAVAQRMGDSRNARELAPEALGATLGDATTKAIARAESGAQAMTLLMASPEFMRR